MQNSEAASQRSPYARDHLRGSTMRVVQKPQLASVSMIGWNGKERISFYTLLLLTLRS
jgi:hypothetical protein